MDREDLKIFEKFCNKYLNIDLSYFKDRVFYKKVSKLYLGFEGFFDKIILF